MRVLAVAAAPPGALETLSVGIRPFLLDSRRSDGLRGRRAEQPIDVDQDLRHRDERDDDEDRRRDVVDPLDEARQVGQSFVGTTSAPARIATDSTNSDATLVTSDRTRDNHVHDGCTRLRSARSVEASAGASAT